MRYLSRRGSLLWSATLQRGTKGPSGPCHMEMEKWALGQCFKRGVKWERDRGVRCEGRGACEQRVDTVKMSQGGGEIRNGRVLAKWGKNRGVRVREVFKNKFTRAFRTVLGVRNGFADPFWTFAQCAN